LFALPTDVGDTPEFAAATLSAVSSTDFELDDAGLEPPDPQDDVSELEPTDDEAPSLPGPVWSEGADRLGQLLARVDRGAGAPLADLPDGAGPSIDVDKPFAASPTPTRRRRRSAVRTLVGVVLGGVIGLAAGYYLLLVFGGPDADALALAQYVPSRLLPDSFQSEPAGPASTPTTPAPPAADQIVATPDTHKTAEVPASFVAPVEPSKETTADDRYAADRAASGVALSEAPLVESATPAEPPQFDDSVARPLSAGGPHVTGAPSYTAGQLQDALASAQQAQAGLVDGDLDDSAEGRTKAFSYTRFCELAEVLTYAKAEPRSDESVSLEREAEQLFAATLADVHSRAEVARIAAIWITSPNRRSGGVMLVGKVVGRSTLGDVDECQLDTGQGARITLLVPTRRADTLDMDQVLGIAGTIVEAPSDRVTGYTGSAPQAVWVHSVLRLP
jgi:hypothetical protein